MIDFIRFDQLKLQSEALEILQFEIFENYQLFDEFTLKQDYKGSAHVHTKTIPLRLGKSITTETVISDLSQYIMIDEMEFRDWDNIKLFGCAEGYVAYIMDGLGLKELGWMTLVSLGPESAILPHKDEGDYCKNFHRFHVCLYSKPFFNKEIEFACDSNTVTVNGNDYVIREGDVFTFDNKSTHSAENSNPDHERIHLIFDAR